MTDAFVPAPAASDRPPEAPLSEAPDAAHDAPGAAPSSPAADAPPASAAGVDAPADTVKADPAAAADDKLTVATEKKPTFALGSVISHTYYDPRYDGDVTDFGLVVGSETRTHTNPDGSEFDEGEHVVVAWLRDLSSPLPVSLFEA